MIPISRKPYTDLVCILCTVLMLALVFLYRSGEKLGIQAVERPQQQLSDLSASAVITLDDEHIRVKGHGAHAENGLITIAYGGNYTFTGQCSNGRIVVQADKKSKVNLIFDNASLSARNAPVVYVANGGNTTISTTKNSKNFLSSLGAFGKEFIREEIDAALFSRDDLILDGKGEMTIFSESCHGVLSKDDLDLRGGVWSVEALWDGIRGRDSIELRDGSYSVRCGGDGMKSNNDLDADRGYITLSGGSVTIDAGEDGIQAFRSIHVTGGAFDITTGGGHGEVRAPAVHAPWIRPGENDDPPDADELNEDEELLSRKGVKAGSSITLEGGSFRLDCRDDGVHCDGDISISGGEFVIESGDDAVHANESIVYANASLLVPLCMEGVEAQRVDILSGSLDITAVNDGMNANGLSRGVNMSSLAISGGQVKLHAQGDGIDSNGHIIITGGEVFISADPTDGNSAVDYGIENGGDCTISGGTIVACGFSGMAEMFSDASSQCSVLYTFEEALPGGTLVELLDERGNVLLSFAPENLFDCVIFSCPKLKVGSAYTIRALGSSYALTPESITGRYGETIERPDSLPPHDPSQMGGFGG